MIRLQASGLRRLLACVVLFLVVACARVDQESFDKVRTGMTTEEVEAILGKPTRTDGSGVGVGGVSVSQTTHVWESGDRRITGTFVNGKLLAKTKEGF